MGAKKYLETEICELFYRDIKTTIDESGASCIHLRKHPDFNEKENWSYCLRDYLIKKGINAKHEILAMFKENRIVIY